MVFVEVARFFYVLGWLIGYLDTSVLSLISQFLLCDTVTGVIM